MDENSNRLSKADNISTSKNTRIEIETLKQAMEALNMNRGSSMKDELDITLRGHAVSPSYKIKIQASVDNNESECPVTKAKKAMNAINLKESAKDELDVTLRNHEMCHSHKYKNINCMSLNVKDTLYVKMGGFVAINTVKDIGIDCNQFEMKTKQCNPSKMMSSKNIALLKKNMVPRIA